MPSADGINTKVIEIDLKTSPDADPVRVENLKEPIAIVIPLQIQVVSLFHLLQIFFIELIYFPHMGGGGSFETSF